MSDMPNGVEVVREVARRLRYDKGPSGCSWGDIAELEGAVDALERFHTATCEALEDQRWPILCACQKPQMERCMCPKCCDERADAALSIARGEKGSK